MKRNAKPSYSNRAVWHPGMGRCLVRPFKRCYPTRSKARKACRVTGMGSIYPCDVCGKFHTTHYPENIARGIAYLLASIRDDRRKKRHPKETA